VKKKLILTEDGSHTLFVPELNEHYHSVHGAIQESKYVYINEGFYKSIKNPLNILEIGFGTGLNALLTYIEASSNKVEVDYHAIEPYTLDPEMVAQLNYCQLIDFPEIESVFSKLHLSCWGEPDKISQYFTFHKIKAKLQGVDLPSNYFNIVYFDAFAPAVQPELWTREIFIKLFQAISADGLIVTYSAKGEIRRLLNEAGFKVERIPGPPGKREMLRGIKVIQA